MHPKRKNCNKENNKQTKRTPLANLPSLACTDDLRLSHNSTDLKHFVKTLDLRKPSSGNPYKKTVSRKSNSKSVKQNPSYQPPKLKCLMKQFKELKLLHENERSKSRSPVSCKSRSMQKQLPKKQSLGTLGRVSRDSEPNLCVKLQRTIKKLNETNFFREDDSLIPLSRNSDMSSRTKKQVLLTESDEIVDLGEMREFCSTASLAFKKEAIAFKTLDIFQETMAAIKIQRAWRNYQTKRLISRYAFLYKHQEHLNNHVVSERDRGQLESSESPKSSVLQNGQLIFLSEEEKKFEDQGREANDREQERSSDGSHCSEYSQMVQKMKIQELQKWNQIITIISNCRTESPQALQQLLLKLAQQSQLNKRQLEQKITSILAHDTEQKVALPSLPKPAQLGHRRDQSLSSQSQGVEQYDSKKYIDYLDGDIFIDDKLKNPFAKTLPKIQNRISKQQQELLLNSLNRYSPLPRIGDYLQKSQSSRLLQLGSHKRTNSIEKLRRSLSETTLKKVLSEFGESDVKQSEEQINLQLLTRQFLEGSDPQYDNFDMVYSEERLRSKLAELNRLNHQPSLDYPEDKILEECQEPKDALVPCRGQCALRTAKKESTQIKIQEEEASPSKLSQVDSCSSDQELVSKIQQKSETVTAILMNNLMVELLKQIASSDAISSSFKSYSLGLRPKIRKVQGRKKKGFPTNKAEIELFLQGLLSFLQKEDPTVFASLQVPTGPSALEMLRYMHQCEEEPEEEESQEDESNVMVIPNRVFDAYWGVKEKSIVIEVPNGYDQSNSIMLRHQFELLKSFNKIFYRSLFDTFNQCLDCERNFGQYGKPFPWKKTPAFSHRKSDVQLKSSVDRARRKMVQLSTTYCGLIVQQQEMQTISQEYVEQVHEDRLSRMLASDLVEAEQRWVFYDDEETEILVEVANAIYTQLLIELIEGVYDIQ